ncbi:MAG: hypothetical protein HYW38_00310 [Candidatus Colwellbacteria bacterium]|nr:hypothetical protein [Candidatus Colwellbacteria bacterium]
MLIGHQKLTETFKRLIRENKLSHGYIFFGEPEVGKFSFALNLATPSETLVIQPDEEGTIGINNIRESKYFLFQKPVYSSRRTVIIDGAERLTLQAQHAILKIAEEPPGAGLIILVLSNPEVLLPTLQSRLQKIYFSRVSSALITAMLTAKFKITKAKAAEIAKLSFGRPGRAIKLLESRKQKVESRNKKGLIEEMIESNDMLAENLTEIIAELAKDPVKNYENLKLVLHRLTLISQFNTNKRLQLESALWNI